MVSAGNVWPAGDLAAAADGKARREPAGGEGRSLPGRVAGAELPPDGTARARAPVRRRLPEPGVQQGDHGRVDLVEVGLAGGLDPAHRPGAGVLPEVPGAPAGWERGARV